MPTAKKEPRNVLYCFITVLGLGLLFAGSLSPTTALASGTDFEGGSLSGWDTGSQSGGSNPTNITGNGQGVNVINGAATFNAPTGVVWSFSPFGSYAASLQPKGEQTFDQATASLGLPEGDVVALKGTLVDQAQATGNGMGQPTDASWITKTVSLTAGTTYTMSWNYIGTDYVPYNDGSITSLVTTGSTAGASVTVNNRAGSYALLGFTNPGTGDYSTGSYASTGWQVSTYQVSVTGDYLLGFAVFNLDDTALSPVLLVDNQPGGTTKDGEVFGAVPPNNSDAPTVPPATTEPPTTTEDPTTTTEAPVTTDPVTTDPVTTDPVTTDVPVETEPPVTEAPEETPTTRPRPKPTTTTEVVETTTSIVAPVESTTTTLTPVVDTLPVTGTGTDFVTLLGFLSTFAGGCLLITRRLNKGS